jgi:hypothetical protein
VVCSKVGEALKELAISDPFEHFDLLPDEEVDPSDIVANYEVLFTKELGDGFHVFADDLEGLFVGSCIHMPSCLALDV